MLTTLGYRATRSYLLTTKGPGLGLEGVVLEHIPVEASSR